MELNNRTTVKGQIPATKRNLNGKGEASQDTFHFFYFKFKKKNYMYGFQLRFIKYSWPKWLTNVF